MIHSPDSLINDTKSYEKTQEILYSLVFYLKDFSNIQRFLEYVVLASIHIANAEETLLVPLNQDGSIKFNNLTSFPVDLSSNKYDFIQDSNCNDINSLENLLFKRYSRNAFQMFQLNSRGIHRGNLYLSNQKSLLTLSSLQMQNLKILVNLAAVGIENYQYSQIVNQHERVDMQLTMGAEIQSQLLPDSCPIIDGAELAACCRPAFQLGGDYYDFLPIKPNLTGKRRAKGKWAFLIGDVMGKGVPAGLLMTMLRGMIRAEVLTGLPPERILHDLNQLAIADLDQSHRFVTLFYSDYDPRTKRLRFSNAAHNLPLIWRASQRKILRLDAPGVLIGLQEEANYEAGEILLEKSDVILYYTDGVTEAPNAMGDRFGEERLIQSLVESAEISLSAKDILINLFKKLDQFVGKGLQLQDDASMVVLRIKD
tara:strand:- start:1897 stop:3171 length:1275 start_codon:yes stop_codon:yes gene_type:complete